MSGNNRKALPVADKAKAIICRKYEQCEALQASRAMIFSVGRHITTNPETLDIPRISGIFFCPSVLKSY